MKINFKIIFTLLIIVGIGSCILKQQEHIKTITSFNEVDFKKISSDTLVIFDVDETLIQPEDVYLINENSQEAKKFKTKVLAQHPEIKDWNALFSIILLEAKRPLLEPYIVDNIQELKNRNIPVIALTAMNTGPLGTIPMLEDWRYNQLKSVGFEGSFENLIFPVSIAQGHPAFYKGILAADLQPKGPVLGAFLDYMKWKPKNIIMFDDSKQYLLTVLEECKKRGITFQGYQYKRAYTKAWDENLVQFQANYLIEHKKWLNDEQAKILMDKGTQKYAVHSAFIKIEASS